MVKKSFIAISLFCFIIVISSSVFATNIVEGTQNTLGNIKNGVQNMVTDAGNTMQRAGNGISNIVNNGKDALQDMGNGTRNAVNDVSRDAEGATRNVEMDTGDAYTATRTAATNNNGTTTGNTALIWIVLAITGIVIIALVWYYGAQAKNNRDNY